MSLKQHNTVHLDKAHCEGGAGDADSCDGSSCSSCQSTPWSNRECSSREGSWRSSIQSVYEDEADTSANQTSATLSPHKKQVPKTSKSPTLIKAEQWCPKQKSSHAVNRKAPLFPQIKPLEGPKQRIWSAHMHSIKELRSHVCELKHQLSGATMENRLLKQLQGRHTAALQRFQESESSLPQVLLKHSNEARAQQELLRKARVHRNTLARRVRATEDELLCTKDALHRLQLIIQDQSLEEREQLSQKLALVSIESERKNKRIQDLERNLELSHASFYRHLATETRKTNDARELSDYLQAQISQLTQKIKDRERELEIHNIYSHRFPKGWHTKGKKETKFVQTDNISPLPIEAPCPPELEYPIAEHLEMELERHKRLVSWESFAIHYTDTDETAADKSGDAQGSNDNDNSAEDGQDGHSESEEPQLPNDEGCRTQEAAGTPQASEEEQIEPCESQVECTLEDFSNTAHPNNKALKSSPRTKHHYTFKETIQNLHSGKPAYSPYTHSLRRSPPKYIKSQARVENLGSGAYEPSFMTLPAGRGQMCFSPQPGGVVHSKKSSLMKELFGQAQISDPTAMQTGTSRVQSTVTRVTTQGMLAQSHLGGTPMSSLTDPLSPFGHSVQKTTE